MATDRVQTRGGVRSSLLSHWRVPFSSFSVSPGAPGFCLCPLSDRVKGFGFSHITAVRLVVFLLYRFCFAIVLCRCVRAVHVFTCSVSLFVCVVPTVGIFFSQRFVAGSEPACGRSLRHGCARFSRSCLFVPLCRFLMGPKSHVTFRIGRVHRRQFYECFEAWLCFVSHASLVPSSAMSTSCFLNIRRFKDVFQIQIVVMSFTTFVWFASAQARAGSRSRSSSGTFLPSAHGGQRRHVIRSGRC
jgi:hypothetical protein